MELSVIIVSWNTKKILAECLDSFYRYPAQCETEIIVVDNASSDGTQELIKSAYPQVRLIENKENLGFAKGNNVGIEACRGNFICLANSDTVLTAGCLDALMSYLKEHTEVGVVGPKLLNTDLSLQKSCKSFPTLWNAFCGALFLHKLFPRVPFFTDEDMHYFNCERTSPVDMLIGAFLVTRRELVEKVGMLDDNFFFYGEDVDWCRRFHQADYRVVYLADVKVIHHGGASSKAYALKFVLQLQRARFQYLKKHHNLFMRLGYFLIMILHYTIRLLFGIFVFLVGFPLSRASSRQKIGTNFKVLMQLFIKVNQYL